MREAGDDTAAALRQANAEQRLMLDNDLIGIIRVRNQRVVWKNRAMDRIFGYSGAEWNDMPPRRLYFDDETFERMVRDRAEIFRSGGRFRRQLKMQRKDGTPVWIDVHGTLMSHHADNSGEALVMLSDITPIKQAEQARLQATELQAQNAQLLETNRIKDLFLANLSHELRTPLNAVLGFAHLLESGVIAPSSPGFRGALAQIATSSQHLLQLIDSMLDFAKSELGRLEFRPEPVDLTRLIGEVVELQQVSASRRGLGITLHIGDGVGTIHADPVRLRQVVHNCVGNAVKFSHDDGQVQVRVLADGDSHWRLEVEDRGIGIAEADIPRLFQPFHQLSTGPSRTHEGTGLGLAIVRRIVETQGGEVGVRSTLGVGSVFWLRLPRCSPGQGAFSTPCT